MFDLDVEPWTSIKKRDIKPSRVEFGEEIICQSRLMSNVATDRAHHKPVNWSLPKCIEWLQEDLASDQEDIRFLKCQVQRVKEIILNAQRERQDNEARQAGGQWRGHIPYMRLIMCHTNDDMKAVYVRRADARTCRKLDARNSNVRSPTAIELLAEKWNDKGFNPVAVVSDCHVDFSAPINCAHSKVKALMRATPQKPPHRK